VSSVGERAGAATLARPGRTQDERRLSPRTLSIASWLSLAALVGCEPLEPSAPAGIAQLPLIYGEDDRVEALAFEGLSSLLALLPRDALEAPADAGGVPSFGERQGACEGERFSNQPALAQCTGVLIAPDLVLTAAHCFDAVESCRDFLYARNYQLDAAGRLPAVEDLSVFECEASLLVMNTTFLDERELDFAVIRLSEPVPDPALPPLRSLPPLPGEVVTTVGTSGGLPMKATRGVVLGVRAQGDYFDLSGDLYVGGSGSGVFDDAGALLGIHVRGGADFERAPEGCWRSRVVPESGESGTEQANTVGSVLDELCRLEPGIDACDAHPSISNDAGAGAEPGVDEGADGIEGVTPTGPGADVELPAEIPGLAPPESGDSIAPAESAAGGLAAPPVAAADDRAATSRASRASGCTLRPDSAGGGALSGGALVVLVLGRVSQLRRSRARRNPSSSRLTGRPRPKPPPCSPAPRLQPPDAFWGARATRSAQHDLVHHPLTRQAVCPLGTRARLQAAAMMSSRKLAALPPCPPRRRGRGGW
jgi:hypothetical protein